MFLYVFHSWAQSFVLASLESNGIIIFKINHCSSFQTVFAIKFLWFFTFYFRITAWYRDQIIATEPGKQVQNTVIMASSKILAAEELLIQSQLKLQAAGRSIKQANETADQVLAKINDILTSDFLPNINIPTWEKTIFFAFFKCFLLLFLPFWYTNLCCYLFLRLNTKKRIMLKCLLKNTYFFLNDTRIKDYKKHAIKNTFLSSLFHLHLQIKWRLILKFEWGISKRYSME